MSTPSDDSPKAERAGQDATGAAPAPPLASRDRTFLIAKNDTISTFNAGPMDFDFLFEQLTENGAVRDVKRLDPRSFTLQQVGPSILQSVVVATMPTEVAAQLEVHPQVVLEEDHLLTPLPVLPPALGEALDDPNLFSPFGLTNEWQLKLQSAAGDPVVGATVFLYGHGAPVQGRTDADGLVSLSLLNESDSTLRAVYVNPLRDYWSLWVNQPKLTSGSLNTITLRSLSELIPGFPARQHVGWGESAMRLDLLPSQVDGRNIKVAVVDSGAAATTHPDLTAIKVGVDLTVTPSDPNAWTIDTIAHGSHCSGIIAGANSASGIRGFAPAAEVHEARIFPGGRVSSLLDAVDYCIDQQIDVVNMSLGTGGTSQILLQKLAQAKEQGVACIVAAGNSGNAVQFPGVSPDVLTVSAIGLNGHFPEDSYHAQQRWRDGKVDRGFFAAQFSCHGPEVDVCGPGVAIVSSVPDEGFAAWDGTSMATPHIAGLAALVLAHHPDFQTPALRLRTAARVDRLFEILKESAQQLDLGDPTRTGAGLPDAIAALKLDQHGPTSQATQALQAAAIRSALAQVRLELAAIGLLKVDPAALAAPTLDPDEDSPLSRRRAVLVLRAQMEAAGLFDRQLASTSA